MCSTIAPLTAFIFKYKTICVLTLQWSLCFREFLKKFSVTIDAIPDHHPGEEIFNFLNSGKIFNQYTLDLRDSGFIGESAVEKLILKSGKTDQIFLTTQGFLTSAYHYVQCPVPVLKWLFRMMSVHTNCIVSVQILSTLMEITIINGEYIN